MDFVRVALTSAIGTPLQPTKEMKMMAITVARDMVVFMANARRKVDVAGMAYEPNSSEPSFQPLVVAL